jgi:hypothetical protein
MIIVLFLVPVAQAKFRCHVVKLIFTEYTEDLNVALRMTREAVSNQTLERGF